MLLLEGHYINNARDIVYPVNAIGMHQTKKVFFLQQEEKEIFTSGTIRL